MTSTEIAMKLGVSESSVIRFSRSLGFSGFMDFQKSLRKDYQDKVLSISSTITVPAQRVVKRAKLESNSDYINRHFKNAAKNLESALVHNAPATFEEAADTIISSKRKYVAASRGNSCLGDYFLLYLKHMVPNVESANSSAISPIDHILSLIHISPGFHIWLASPSTLPLHPVNPDNACPLRITAAAGT